MSKLTINSYEEFKQYEKQELGVSDYLKISQDRINAFADATLDHQWIHINPEKAKKESPFKSTIAHGYLLVSLLPYLWDDIVEVKNLRMMINYGIEKLRFTQPVLVDSEVRIRINLEEIKNLRGTVKATLRVVMEIKDSPKSALEADVVFLYHFEE